MTNLEVIASSAGLNYPIDEITYKVSLIKNKVNPSADYNPSTDEKGVDLAISDLCLILINSAKKISDDGYSVEQGDVSSLWNLRSFYRRKWGLDDDSPQEKQIILKNASQKW